MNMSGFLMWLVINWGTATIRAKFRIESKYFIKIRQLQLIFLKTENHILNPTLLDLASHKFRIFQYDSFCTG